jgi:putative oxidoreductase
MPAVMTGAKRQVPGVALDLLVIYVENCMQRSDFARWAAVPLRLLVGYGFIEHGFAKLSKGPDSFAGILQQLGVPLPHLAAWLTIGTELVGGLALLLGAFVAWASIPTAAVLLVAMVTVHLPYGFSSVKLLSISAAGAQFGPVGYELDLLYLATLLVLALQGPSPLSIDNLQQRRARQ